MPDHYDRATCATELRLRRENSEKAREQNWKQIGSYEIPPQKPKTAREGDGSEDESSSVSSTSVTSTASFLKKGENIADLSDLVLDFDECNGYI